MSVLVCVTGRNNDKLMAKLNEALPDVKIELWPHCEDLNRVQFVLAWNAPDELWAQLPNLKVVQSYGAGVDGIALDKLKPNVSVARIVDEQLSADMAEYVLSHVLANKLRHREYATNQGHRNWKPRRAKNGNEVGILGLGELGRVTAELLGHHGFSIRGWSRTQKCISNVACYAGEAQLEAFLSGIDYLVCLLPLTQQTKGILNAELFSQVPPNCVLINVARGQHLVEADLLVALDNNELEAAVLDVFSTEPLPESHPFWSHPKVTVTPHVAAVTNMDTVVAQIAANARACLGNNPLENRVDLGQGY
ncbi:glyoxylate/hydroxypyruvate reductase A [Pseudoalteromonas luteoviolacea]|uniref:2-hydroxyacid dehydrogenase n=1 Tax=Pseudoalteromonas luteoviolacea TaxID=43657 RepID=UPI001B37EF8B|nr:glyoxylate/hydroxypyruvate reductase A [Pseudoalteromonas luteoviolacea]MBQ4812284.1 glyoxylate/hydroxypyruvate reductase A [Pseudoalteromonas luteoviolacea]